MGNMGTKKQMISILMLIVYTVCCEAQTIRNCIFNKMTFVSNDTIINGTAYFHDDGYFSIRPIVDTTSRELNEYVTSLNTPSNTLTTEKHTLRVTYNTDRLDTIKYIFDVYECEEFSDLHFHLVHDISDLLYRYSYIVSVFGNTDPRCKFRFIMPDTLVTLSKGFYDVSVFFEDDKDSPIVIKYKHAISKDFDGLKIDICDSVTCESDFISRLCIKKNYRKIMSNFSLGMRIYSPYNPYYFDFKDKKLLISPDNPEGVGFGSRKLDQLVYNITWELFANERKKRIITIFQFRRI